MVNRFIQLTVVIALLSGCNKFGFMSFGGGGSGDNEKKPQPVTENNTKATVETFAPKVSNQQLLDILLVIDNSSTMYPAHQGLSEKLTELLSTVSESDWQIAITTSDPRNCVETIINKQTVEYQQVFSKALSLLKETVGTTHSQPIRMAVAGLKADCVKKRWLRDNSTVVVLIVTDEDNYALQCGDVDSRGLVIKTSLDPKQCRVEALYQYLQEIRVPRVTARVYGLLNDKKNANFMAWKDQQGNGIFDHVGQVYLPTSDDNMVNKADYSEVLRKISQNIKSTMQNTYVLKDKGNAKVEAVVVSHQLGRRKLLTGEYQVNGNVLTIVSELPRATTSIEVTYK